MARIPWMLASTKRGVLWMRGGKILMLTFFSAYCIMYKKIRPPACTPELKLEKSYLIWGWQTSSKLHFGTTIGARLMGLSLLKKNRWHVLPMLSLGMEGVPVLGRETIDCEKICLIAFWQHTGQAGPAVHVDPTCHPSVELGNTHEGIGDVATSHELVDGDFDRHGRRQWRRTKIIWGRANLKIM
jgi:hypothetical protein